MIRRMPLVAMNVFEITARQMSFTKAAAELGITQSAVSRHIKALECYLGVALFERRHRNVSLTPEGETYYRDLSEAFAQAGSATQRISQRHLQATLNVQAYTTFAMRWLIPRLGKFRKQYPGIHIRLTASLNPVDFSGTDVHCAIRSGTGTWACQTDKLCETFLVPVCRKELMETPRDLRHPQEILQSSLLLFSRGRPTDWREWFEGIGLDAKDLNRGHFFESSSMAYEAAHYGLGIAIGQRFLVDDDLKARRLDVLFNLPVKSDETYYLLTSPKYERSPPVEMFRDWIIREARQTMSDLSASPH